MSRRPLLAVGLALTVLAVALLTWVMQRDGEPVQASSAPRTSSATSPPASITREPEPHPHLPIHGPDAPATAEATKAPEASGLRIRIPAIGLDRRMHGAGLSPRGTIDPDPGTVMWFQGYERVRPGPGRHGGDRGPCRDGQPT